MVRILFLGDVFGNAGLDAVERHVPALRDELDLDLVLANGENVAGGAGITARLGARLLAAGIDCLTLGNHTWRRDGIGPYLATAERVVRPANYLRTLPGRGMATVPARDGTPVDGAQPARAADARARVLALRDRRPPGDRGAGDAARW